MTKEEYASKLHLLQQEYDNLSGCYNDLLKVHSGLINESSKLIARNEIIKDEYDKLKGDYQQYVQDFNQLFAEHGALKEKAEKMAEYIHDLVNFPPPHAKAEMGKWIDAAIEDGEKALSSYNSNTNQKDNK